MRSTYDDDQRRALYASSASELRRQVEGQLSEPRDAVHRNEVVVVLVAGVGRGTGSHQQVVPDGEQTRS